MSDKELTVNKDQDLNVAREERIAHWLTPAVDIFENEAGLTLVADLPGVAKDRLNLGIERGVLTLEAVAPAETGGSRIYREFSASGYYRRFQLPDSLDFEQVQAEMKDGVLTVTLPKTAAARPRKIPVTVH